MTAESSPAENRSRLSLALTGGGTGGHVSPAVAVIEELRLRNIDFDALWIGSTNGIERAAACQQHIPYHAVRTGKLRRYFSLQMLPDAIRIPIGVFDSRKILARSSPHVIFSTGGYVGVPAVIAGRTLGIPSLTHEQTADVGIATKINARFSNIIALSYNSSSRPKLRKGSRFVITGNPVRPSLCAGDAQSAAKHFDLAGDRPLVYVTGGAQGASAINQVIAESLETLLQEIEIVHQCGPNSGNGDYARMLQRRAMLPTSLAQRYHPIETLGPELADLYAATKFVVGRSGAGTVAELAALRIPSMLIPLPGAAEQLRNAEILSSVGAALIVEQSSLTSGMLIENVRTLINDPGRLDSMSSSSHAIATENPAGRLVDEIIALARAQDPD